MARASSVERETVFQVCYQLFQAGEPVPFQRVYGAKTKETYLQEQLAQATTMAESYRVRAGHADTQAATWMVRAQCAEEPLARLTTRKRKHAVPPGEADTAVKGDKS